MAVQTKSGRHTRAYLNGQPVGMGRIKSMKPEVSTPLDTVEEMGNGNVLEYVPKVSSETLQFEYFMVSYGQLAIAQGLPWLNAVSSSAATAVNGYIGEVPPIPSQMDVIERLILPGTEHTANEVYIGFALHQKVQIEKQAWDQEVDKLIGCNISAKAVPVRHWEGINNVVFDNFSCSGTTTSFVLTHKAIVNNDGYMTVRADVGIQSGANGTLYAKTWNEGFDYTAASTSSTTTLTFTIAPPSGTMNVLYAY